jgi:hypothetical protein
LRGQSKPGGHSRRSKHRYRRARCSNHP